MNDLMPMAKRGWRVLPVFKAKNKNKMRKDNQLYEIEIREVDKEKKRIKIHYKGFSSLRSKRFQSSYCAKVPLPLPRHPFFFRSCPSFLDGPR